MNRLILSLSAATVLACGSAWGAPATTSTGPRKSVSSAATPDISCPGDVVVWVNPRSKAYHLQGDTFFGHTKRGKFECKKAADTEGDHPIPSKK